jgi:hypothetical protein
MDIRFSKLKVLSMRFNHVASIESIGRIEMPLLQELHACTFSRKKKIIISESFGA